MDTLVLLVMTKVSWIHFTVSNPLCHTQFDRTTIMDWLWPLYTGPMGGGHYTQVVTIIHRSQGWPLSTGCDHYTQVPQAWPLWTGCDHYTQVPRVWPLWTGCDHYTQVSTPKGVTIIHRSQLPRVTIIHRSQLPRGWPLSLLHCNPFHT